jgi:acyl-CoA synthetase (AMP-forming)/AMP-acid ligase II
MSFFDPAAALSLAEVLVRRAEVHPDRLACATLDGQGGVEAQWTYRALDQAARRVASVLRRSVAPSEAVVLLVPTPLEIAAAFFGCLYAGVVAVPALPTRSATQLAQLAALTAAAGARALVTTRAWLSAFEPAARAVGARPLHLVSIEEALQSGEADARPVEMGPDTIALLQYTSGSTSAPKGVVVRHRHLLHNEAMITAAFGHDENTRVASWLPLYHDMGLIGCLINPLYVGGCGYFMDPLAFVQSPYRWLQAISRLRITTSGAPNFGYELCRQRVKDAQREMLDLSSWTVAFCGAEPVRRRTLEGFTERFAAVGFRAEAFLPCYGLAEATLFVTGGTRGEGWRSVRVSAAALERGDVEVSPLSEGARDLVDCGPTWLGQEVAIVDPETRRRCPESRVGEIWIAGPCVTSGYWNQPEVTLSHFTASLLDTGQGPYLRSGDLGFLRDGRLFVTGRLDDLIIIDGRNHYPHDIEHSVESSHPRLAGRLGAAFAVEDGGEPRLVILQESDVTDDQERAEVTRAIRTTVSELHGLNARTVVLVATGAIPRTTSGKVRRAACRKGFLEHAAYSPAPCG